MDDLETKEYRQLLRQIAKGDQLAFAKLYDIFWPELLRHILGKISDAQAAEDIIHDLFVSLWNRRASILEIESIPAYLYSACRYMVFKHYRQHAVISRTDYEISDDVVADERPLDERLYYRYLLDMVNKEIEKLPDKCKHIFNRYSYLTNKEIAEKLAISESTVENHINKAIRRLRLVSKNNHIFFQLFF
jgi:RNA polymerase sigma-70 factor (ECF subfamily)